MGKKSVSFSIGNLRTATTALSTTTGSELQCTAQARLVNSSSWCRRRRQT